VSPLINGSKSVFSFYLPETVSIFKSIQNYRCNTLLGPPTILIDLINHPDRTKYDLSALQNILLGAATVPPDLIHKAKTNMKIENMIIGYGMTETSLGQCKCSSFNQSSDFAFFNSIFKFFKA
jgi:acyl-CoA synthetase (AMP-forming)/AMP-acid ligase II